MQDYVQLDPIAQAKVAMSFARVRFLCNQCGQTHYLAHYQTNGEPLYNYWDEAKTCMYTFADRYPNIRLITYIPDLVLCLVLKPGVLKKLSQGMR